MKFKIRCLCGQQMMIITRSQRKVIRCPACNQKIEAIAPADEHSMPELTGAIFDDVQHIDPFARLPFQQPAPQQQYQSKIVKRPATQYQKSGPGFNWVPLAVAGGLGVLIIVCLVLLFLPDQQTADSGKSDDGDDSGRRENRRVMDGGIATEFPAELSRPNIINRFGNATIEMDVKIGGRDVLTNAGKVLWVVKSDSGQRFEKNITYKMIYGLERQGTITFELDEVIQRYPIQTYLEAVVEPDTGKVDVVSNVLVIDADGRVLGQ